ncbi:MAG: FAD-containing oxidoreductase [Clostridia bacterium]|nr:FAD-containing oxidoreductase [Deltaproteobacteria bacterium]
MEYDAIIIGGGQAGPALAGRLTAAGQTVAYVERHLMGGTCVNTGCMPTKTLVASAHAAHVVHRAAEFGVVLPSGEVRVDVARAMERAHEVTRDSRQGLESWLNGMERLTLVRGHARFVSRHEVQVGSDHLMAKRIFINVGGRASRPAFPGIDKVPVLTNTTMLQVKELPEHLVVIGGSYIGLEFAQIFRRFGSQVTIVERSDRLVSREDPDVSGAIAEFLRTEGINVRLSAECIGFPSAKKVRVSCHAGEPEIEASHILLAVGRTPNTHDLGLEAAGIDVDTRGYITVDDELKTSVDGVYALGDCNGRGGFTHTAYNDFEIVAANLLDGEKRRVSDRFPVYALFTDPPLARCGMTETEARQSGRRVLMGVRPMTQVGRAVEKSETYGFMKVLVDADNELILGASLLGTGCDEAIHCIIDVMSAKASYKTITRAVHIHPTVAELIPTVLADLHPL